MDHTEQHKSCRAGPVCPWARLSWPRPNPTVGTSRAKPASHGDKSFIQIGLSTPITPATTANHQEALSRAQGGNCSPCSAAETASLGCGPEVPGHGRGRSLHQHKGASPALPISFCSVSYFPCFVCQK